MKVVIIDDEQSAINALVDKLKPFPEVKIVGTANNGKEGLECIKATIPDLLFLDVEMPDISGIVFLDEMANCPTLSTCKVVVYTSYEGYMLPAFRKEAFDYLHKPIEFNELDAIMDRFYAHQQEPIECANEIIGVNDKEQDHKKILLYTNAIDFLLVHVEDIGLFIYNHQRRIWEVIIAEKEKPIALKRSVTSKMILDTSQDFIQVHQSYIINFKFLLEVVDNKCTFIHPFENVDYVRIGRYYRHRLIERFCSL
jgi:two-component system LytT family response regulator